MKICWWQFGLEFLILGVLANIVAHCLIRSCPGIFTPAAEGRIEGAVVKIAGEAIKVAL